MKTNRRNFISNSLKIAGLTFQYPILSSFINFPNTGGMDAKIDGIELFRYDVNIPTYFSTGVWYNRQHLFMKISSGHYYGWSETPAAINTPNFDPKNWIEFISPLKGLTVDAALKRITSYQIPGTKIPSKQLEFIEMGLLDLAGRLQNKPAIELLNLNQRDPVPGLYCILENDLEKAKTAALAGINDNFDHIKFKMYGDEKLDTSLLELIRQLVGKKAMVMSDVNMGYKNLKSVNEIASLLIGFRKKGLNAIEDPAELSIEQWIQLQKKIGNLSLIPDVPLRPSWIAIDKIKKGMGNIYNLHPSVTGSFRHAALLANKIMHEMEAKVMVGDDSLVGPGCSAWQQIAIGIGAVWVEAREKIDASKQYLECVVNSPTYRDNQGYFSLTPKPGFGVELDTERLKKYCHSYFLL